MAHTLSSASASRLAGLWRLAPSVLAPINHSAIRINWVRNGGTAPQPASHAAQRRVAPVVVLLADFVALTAIAAFVDAPRHVGDQASMGPAALNHATVSLFGHAGSAALVATVLMGCLVQGHYAGRPRIGAQAKQLVSIVTLALFAAVAVQALAGGTQPMVAAMAPWLGFVPLAFAGRVCTRLLDPGAPVRTLLIGDDEAADAVAAALGSGSSHRVVETIGAARFVALAGSQGGQAMLAGLRAGFAVVALGGQDPDAERAAVRLLDREGARYGVAPHGHGFPAAPASRLAVQSFGGHDVLLMQVPPAATDGLTRAAKIGFDKAVAAVMVLLLAPLLAVLTVVTRMDGGPALFSHTRIGRNGTRFGCLKFRTMVTDAEQRLANLLASDPEAAAEWEATRKLRHDPRITRMGAFLRKTSLDELPQLFNVLRGEMSLVGPRPIVAAEMDRYDQDAAYYMRTRPGLTGLWQVSGRSDTSYERRVRLDVWYVRNWSFWHDLTILVKTVPAVLLRRGSV